MDQFVHQSSGGAGSQGRAANETSRRRRRREPYSWLGLGAIGLGVGAALAAGSPAAYADTEDSGSASSQSESVGRSSSASGHSGKAVRSPAATVKGSAPRNLSDSSASKSIAASTESTRESTPSTPKLGAESTAESSDETALTRTRFSADVQSAAAVPVALAAAPVTIEAVELSAVLPTVPTPTRQLPTATVQAALQTFGALPSAPLAPIVGPLAGLLWGATRKSEVSSTEVKTTATSLAAAATPTVPSSVSQTVSSDWGSGHTAAVTVSAGSTALNGWTVEFDSPAQITNIWNAQITSQVGTHYVISNMSYNGKVASGQSTSFGYQATQSGTAGRPTNLTINGVGSSNPSTTPPTISIADVSVAEGNSGTTNANFVVTLSKASTTPVTVGYATANGTATAGADYTATSGTLTFAPGVTSQTVAVKVTGDTAVEANETFTVALTNPSGGTIARASATGTITNDDAAPLPTVSIADVSVAEGNSGTTNANFTLTLSKASTTPVTVAYSTANGTATAGADFTATSGTVTFAPGATSQTVTVKVAGDTVVEANETFTVTLASPSGATIARATATGTITNDDVATAPTVSIADVSVAEGNSGTTNANFTVTLSKASTTPITINYATANGTATAGADYTAASGTLTFAPGVTSQTVTVKVTGDSAVESNETFTVTLSSPSGATIAKASATGTITNDDVATPPQGTNSVTYSVVDDWGSGHNANMTINAGQKLTGWTVEFDSPAQITNIWNAQIVSHVGTHYVISNVSYNGTVAAGGSTSFGYQATPGAVAATPTNLKVNGVAVTNPTTTPSISISDKTVNEGNGGTSNATFTVTLSSASTNPVTVNYATSNGTAMAGSDYTATSGTLTFAPGVTTQTVNVAVIGDTTVESNETFAVTLSNPSGGTISRGTATGTITNDDQTASTLPTASIADLSVTEGNGDHMHFMFTVTLSKASDTPVTIQYATADGTATGGVDYVSGSGTVTFAPGVTSQMIHVDIKGDAVFEPNETFTVTLSNPSGVTIARATATGTIVNDDTDPEHPHEPGGGDYIDITAFGVHGGSDHTGHNALVGGRTAITTEAVVAYNNLREFAGLAPATIEQVGTWAFANRLTNNAGPSGQDIQGVGLWYAMQGAKVGWMADDTFDPQIVADIERAARLGTRDQVMAMVAQYGHEGFAEFLTENGYETAFINTLKMEPHYGGIMHSRAHGGLSIEGVATAHDVNHLTVLSHDQMKPFMNDTWDWPQWPALNVSHAGVLEYFQSMVTLGNPLGQNLTDLSSGHTGHTGHEGHSM